MRHHTTSIVGPDLDGPEMRECKCVDGPGPCGRFIKHTVRNDRQIEVCCGCGAETDVGPAWTGCIKASDLEPPSKSNHSETPNSCQAPAQPSVGERLAVVAFDEDSRDAGQIWARQDESTKQAYRNIALAARREVLKEGFAEEDTEAAAKAFWNATLPGIAWDELREASRKPIRVQAAAALSAAIASRVARESKVTP